MSNAAVPQCTHVKTNGEVCGSPAASGSEFCYHHSAVKTALGKAKSNGKAPEEGFAPIPFLFPEDHASMQVNLFLLLEAFNEQRIDQRTCRLLLSMLKAMAKNLGKSGSLVDEASDQGSAVSDQEDRDQGPGRRDQVSDQRSAVSDQKDRDQGPERRDQEEAGQSSGKSGGLAIHAGSVAAESCFSKNPRVQLSGNDLFRMSPSDRAGHGFHQAARAMTR